VVTHTSESLCRQELLQYLCVEHGSGTFAVLRRGVPPETQQGEPFLFGRPAPSPRWVAADNRGDGKLPPWRAPDADKIYGTKTRVAQ
jgi:hypothetical protein